MPIPKSIPVFINVLKSEHLDKLNEEEILYFKTKEIYIECMDKLITDIDGEKGPDFPLHIQCIEEGIKLLGVK
jgi:diacylglycerol kinase family enzyme